MCDNTTKLYVAAIDFGTTYSGYAYSLKAEYVKDPFKIYAKADWADGVTGFTVKAPTTILFNPEGKFHSFGYEAEIKYSKLAEENVHMGWRYFRRFKMELYKRISLRRNIKLADEQGNEMLATDVFAAAIRYLKDHMLMTLQERVNEIRATDIYWVLTVPAIWSEAAKQFMMEAAEKAGIRKNQLTLALEAEVAALYCKELAVVKAKEHGNEVELKYFDAGTQFMVLDIGGGTVDITVHEMQPDGTLKELHPPIGGPYGGVLVDENIMKFLKELFGYEVMDKVQKQYKESYLELHREIEMRKREFKRKTADENNNINFRIPIDLFDVFEMTNSKKFDAFLSDSTFSKTVNKKRDKLMIGNELFHEMFKMSKDKVIFLIQQLFSNSKLKQVQTLIMVGGFSESEVMKEAVRQAFHDKHVIVPEEAGVAVLKGAVLYGQNPNAISSREIPYTIGISVAVPYDYNIHPTSSRVVRNGHEKCEGVFKVFVKKGTVCIPGKTTVEYLCGCPFPDDKTAVAEIYKSDADETPMYVLDESCKRLGEVVLKLEGESLVDTRTSFVTVSMVFGYPIIHVSLKEDGTNNSITAAVNFL